MQTKIPTKLWEKEASAQTRPIPMWEWKPLDTRDLGCVKVVPLEEHLGMSTLRRPEEEGPVGHHRDSRGDDSFYLICLSLSFSPTLYLTLVVK